MSKLKASFQQENLTNVMCRNMLSIDYQGYVYDCDFNQMLGLDLRKSGRGKIHISDLMNLDLSGNEIRVGQHCFGCTAGQGSSCSGALQN